MSARFLLFSLLSIIAFTSCTDATHTTAANANFTPSASDYQRFLDDTTHKAFAKTQETIAFWSARIAADSNSFSNYGAAAGGYSGRFQITGDVTDLQRTELLMRRGYELSGTGKDGFARGLAANLISQHRFAEAKQILTDVEALGNQSIKQPEQNGVWFDVLMELGEYDAARYKLGEIRNTSNFGYLIREAKWQDYQGDLDEAISYLEQARDRTESSDNTGLRIWSYTNIGDFYGHAGRIEDAYNSYLAALELDPDNAYALKSIAYIQYAHAGNYEEANRILDHVMSARTAPDYYLLKADIATSANQPEAAAQYKQQFEASATQTEFGDMYNTYLIEHWVDSNPSKALALAKREVSRRDTPESRQLLALAHYKSGDNQAAIATLENHVIDKTSEPMALLHAAQIYKATGQHPERLKEYKEELMGAAFELGPITYKEVQEL